MGLSSANVNDGTGSKLARAMAANRILGTTSWMVAVLRLRLVITRLQLKSAVPLLSLLLSFRDDHTRRRDSVAWICGRRRKTYMGDRQIPFKRQPIRRTRLRLYGARR